MYVIYFVFLKYFVCFVFAHVIYTLESMYSVVFLIFFSVEICVIIVNLSVCMFVLFYDIFFCICTVQTPLALAIQKESIEIMKLLFKYGANINMEFVCDCFCSFFFCFVQFHCILSHIINFLASMSSIMCLHLFSILCCKCYLCLSFSVCM